MLDLKVSFPDLAKEFVIILKITATKKFSLSLSQMETKEEIYSYADIARLRERFEHLDKNGRGRITKMELERIPELAANPMAERIICGLLGNQDSLDFDGFCLSLSPFFVNSRELKLQLAFRIFDSDNDGLLGAVDLFNILKAMVGNSVENKDIERMVDDTLHTFDDDGDKFLNWVEFKKAMFGTRILGKMKQVVFPIIYTVIMSSNENPPNNKDNSAEKTVDSKSEDDSSATRIAKPKSSYLNRDLPSTKRQGDNIPSSSQPLNSNSESSSSKEFVGLPRVVISIPPPDGELKPGTDASGNPNTHTREPSSDRLSQNSKHFPLRKLPSKPRLSMDALGPLIQDRPDIQSPIKLENEIPEVARELVRTIKTERERRASQELSRNSKTYAAPPPSSNLQNDKNLEISSANIPAKDLKGVGSPVNKDPPADTPPSFVTQVTQPTGPVSRPVLDIAAARKAAEVAKADAVKAEAATPQTSPPTKKSFLDIFYRICPCFGLPQETHTESLPLADLGNSKPQSPLSVALAKDVNIPEIGAIEPNVEYEEPRLLPPSVASDKGRKCLVLDLDETLLHSSFKPVDRSDFTIPVEIDNIIHTVFVLKRPHVDQFLEAVAKDFELVIFTASLSKYADPVLDILDPKRLIKYRLFRESCTNLKGNYIKDLALLGRDLASTIIIDNSPNCYMLQPSNAIPITSWFDDAEDRELLDLVPFLEDLSQVDDVREVLTSVIQQQELLIPN